MAEDEQKFDFMVFAFDHPNSFRPRPFESFFTVLSIENTYCNKCAEVKVLTTAKLLLVWSEMKDLSVIIRKLRGELSQVEMAAKCGVSPRTITNLENGESVKLDTLRAIRMAYRATDSEWLRMLAAWAKAEIGPDAAYMWIEPIENEKKVKDNNTDAKKIQRKIHELNAEERRQLLLLLQRPEIRRVLPALNKLYDKLQ
ncbi:MAG: helix-turn-helix domain-containing protein [Verrucomicrobiota bacterium]